MLHILSDYAVMSSRGLRDSFVWQGSTNGKCLAMKTKIRPQNANKFGSSIGNNARQVLKMQLDVGTEPYMSTAQALCLLIGHTFYHNECFLSQFDFWPSNFWSSHRQTARQTESDAYEPTMHTYKWAQKCPADY